MTPPTSAHLPTGDATTGGLIPRRIVLSHTAELRARQRMVGLADPGGNLH
jgi:hypothetical protein